jgi:hypothetical protein
MVVSLYDLLADWSSLGLYDIVLPFLLVYTLVFAVLQKSKLFGEDNKGINAIIALIVGLFVVRSETVVLFLTGFLPNISLFLVVILMFLLMVGLFSGEHSEWVGAAKGLAVIISLVFIVLAIFAGQVGTFNVPRWILDFIDPQTRSTIIFVAVFAIVIAWVTSTGKKKESYFDKVIKGMGKK